MRTRENSVTEALKKLAKLNCESILNLAKNIIVVIIPKAIGVDNKATNEITGVITGVSKEAQIGGTDLSFI